MIKNILAPIDFSDVTDEVIKSAAQFAKAFAAKLWIVHVAAPDPDFVGYDVGPQHVREWRADTLRREHKVIQDEKKKLERDGLDVEGLLIQGPVIETILKEASKVKADLIVAGSHGRGGFVQIIDGQRLRRIGKKDFTSDPDNTCSQR